MYYTKQHLLKLIQNKDLAESYLEKIIKNGTYSTADSYDLVLELIRSDYLSIAKTILFEIKEFVSQNPLYFTQIREIIPKNIWFDEILDDIENNLVFDFNQANYQNFNEFINKNKLNLKFCYEIAKNTNYTPFLQKLIFLEKFNITNTKNIEQYLNQYLSIHQDDINIEREEIKKEIKQNGFDIEKQNIYDIEKPKQNYTYSLDWTVDMANKKEFFIYSFKEELLEKDKIYENPYFLFVKTEKIDYFIWKRYYKDAILSYTSNFARSIRYANEINYNYIDLLIKNSKYQKIFIRNAENTNQIDVESTSEQTLQEKVEKSAWIADISNLLTDYQDLIFRSPLKWTVLVEWVAWSGKTNLIFHRIDYLLQEYPERFKKENIWIIVKNIYLKEYMIWALNSTDFGFKDDIQVNIFDELFISLIINCCDSPQVDFTYKINDIKSEFENIETRVSKYFINLLENNINNLQKNVIKEFEEILKPQEKYSSMNQVTIKWLENYSNPYLNEITQQINSFSIDSHKGFYHNLLNFENNIYEFIKKLKQKWVISDRKINNLEENIELLFNKFKEKTSQKYFKNNMVFFSQLENFEINNHYILKLFLIEKIAQNLENTNIIPRYDSLLVDEFQDFKFEELYLLSYFYKSMVWSWDLTQSIIYSDKSFLENFDIVDSKLIQDNFRNTLEIVKFANEILKNCKIYNLNVKRVNRKWAKPNIIEQFDLNQIKSIISNSKQSNKKLWVVYFNKTTIKDIIKNSNLKYEDYYFDIEKDKKFENKYDIYFFDYANIKGLEFDNVILLQVEDLIWDSFHQNALKLFYIGITRAVNNLYIFSTQKFLDKLNIDKNLYNIQI